MKINKYILEITVFTCGAVVMTFEIVGSRVLGPYLGTSIFVWTSLIGIVLASLSLGYYIGGKLADKKPDIRILSFVIFLAAIFIGFTILIKDFFLILLQMNIADLKIKTLIASICLFSPASIALGFVSPYAIKLKLESLNNSGSTVGTLYAISTSGSIVGTFLSGFYLIPYFGTNKLLIMLSIILLLISLLLSAKKLMPIKLSFLIIIIIGFFSYKGFNYPFNKNTLLFVDIDTAYSRIWIHDQVSNKDGDIIRNFSINNERSSAMFLKSDELVFQYTKYYHLVKHFYPNFKKALMIGGAGYSYPKNFLLEYPDAKIDVVEIDPKVTEIAKEYFKLQDNPRLTIYHEDGRIYLNKTKEKYDVIFGDAFSSQYSLPYHLTTKEAIKRKYDVLNDEGVVIVNIISAITGEKGKFLRAEYATYKSVFPQVYLFPVISNNNGDIVQNIILIALKSDQKPNLNSDDDVLNSYLQNLWEQEIDNDMPILTDNFAPVDYYISKTI